MQVLVSCQLLTEAEMEECIDTEFNPTQVAFRGGQTVLVEDCLNLGVSPRSGAMAWWLPWHCCRAVVSSTGPAQSSTQCCAPRVDKTCSQQAATGKRQRHLSMEAE